MFVWRTRASQTLLFSRAAPAPHCASFTKTRAPLDMCKVRGLIILGAHTITYLKTGEGAGGGDGSSAPPARWLTCSREYCWRPPWLIILTANCRLLQRRRDCEFTARNLPLLQDGARKSAGGLLDVSFRVRRPVSAAPLTRRVDQQPCRWSAIVKCWLKI